MAVATRATPTAAAIQAVMTDLGRVEIVMTVHATSTMTSPTVIAPVPGFASTAGSPHDPPAPTPPAAPVPVDPKPPPAPPTPVKSLAANVKSMTPEERAFIQAKARHRITEPMAAMGLTTTSLSTPKPTLNNSTGDRLAHEKKEAEERARAAEKAAAERARQRDERLRGERRLILPCEPSAGYVVGSRCYST
jgi:hypothetical protein